MHVRPGNQEDLPQIFELVKELAEFERAGDQVTNSVQRMEQDGFGPNPAFGFLVAEDSNKIVGLSLYYFRYSTWKGRRLWLEDIIVTEEQRGQGIGKILFERTIDVARESDCTGMMWQVLDWNEPAITFYKKYNATMDGEWINCYLDF